jgi:hypothetical protein
VAFMLFGSLIRVNRRRRVSIKVQTRLTRKMGELELEWILEEPRAYIHRA